MEGRVSAAHLTTMQLRTPLRLPKKVSETKLFPLVLGQRSSCVLRNQAAAPGHMPLLESTRLSLLLAPRGLCGHQDATWLYGAALCHPQQLLTI